MSLTGWGWSDVWSAAWAALMDDRAADPLEPGRVVARDRGSWDVVTEAGPVRVTLPAGSERPSRVPAVGDWVAVRGERIVAVLPRRSSFTRRAAGDSATAQVVAANVDRAFLMTAAGRDFSVRRLERYLTLAWDGGVRPVVVITKADLADDVDALVAEAAAVAFGATVHAVSSVTGRGLDTLESELVPGETVALLGSSGVGKSTLLNRLAGSEVAATAVVRTADDKGRHTTTRRELHALPSGVLLLDTPGMRELALWASEEGLGLAFPDIERLAEACRFRDCRHDAEPGCAVLAGVEEGTLPEDRLLSWRKLQKEIAWQERKADPALAAEHEKSLHHMMKTAKLKYRLQDDP